MVFSSVTFVLVFLPLALLLYFGAALICRGSFKYRLLNIILIILSLLFYAWGEPSYVVLLMASMGVNYFIALAIEVNHGHKNSGLWLFIGVTANILFLIYFKYINFLISTKLFGMILPSLPEEIRPAPNFHIALPLGISFYTFQAISYLIDIHRRQAKVARSLIDFGCYLTMFPQLVAGPIVRYESIAKELEEREISLTGFTQGCRRFIFGLAKKMLLADTFGRVADAAFSVPNDEVSTLVAWAGMVAYTFQIYFDFSGYSDMAIGLGRMFGFTFPENFNYPYISRSIREFWRRWHMTLSGWFRDYLYIPLGGNRHGTVITCLNLMVVFALCGFWHGADWVFLLWGLYHGSFLVLERFLKNFPERMPSALAHSYTIAVFMIGWLLFRSESVDQFTAFVHGLFCLNHFTPQTFRVCIELFAGDVYIALIAGILLAMPCYPYLAKKLNAVFAGSQFKRSLGEALSYIWSLMLLLICMMPLFGATYNAFIYFRF